MASAEAGDAGCGASARTHIARIIRHEKTLGLISAKKSGGDAATGDVIEPRPVRCVPPQQTLEIEVSCASRVLLCFARMFRFSDRSYYPSISVLVIFQLFTFFLLSLLFVELAAWS